MSSSSLKMSTPLSPQSEAGPRRSIMWENRTFPLACAEKYAGFWPTTSSCGFLNHVEKHAKSW